MSDFDITYEEVKKWDEKSKFTFSKAKVRRYVVLCVGVVATVVVSLFQVGWNPSKIGWEVFFANTALLLFLGIYGIFFGENEGNNLFKNIITGVYQTARDTFLDVVEEIIALNFADALPDYISWRYQKDYENECKMRLLSVRIFDTSILDLQDEQIEMLRDRPLKISDKIYYSKLSEEQYEVVQDIRCGRVFVDYIDDYNYFLNDEESGKEQQATRAKNANKRKEKISWQQRITRVLMIAIVAFIIAGFFKKVADGGAGGGDPVAEAEAKFQAIRDLVSRICCLVVSIASGFNTARLLNLEDVFVLKYKTSYDKVFLCSMKNGTFKPVDYKAKAKADYEQYEKEEEEAKKNVVTPVVEEPEENKVPMLEDKTIYQ